MSESADYNFVFWRTRSIVIPKVDSNLSGEYMEMKNFFKRRSMHSMQKLNFFIQKTKNLTLSFKRLLHNSLIQPILIMVKHHGFFYSIKI